MKNLYLTIFVSIMLSYICFGQSLRSEQLFRDKQDSVFSLLFTDTENAKKEIDLLFEQSDEMSDTTVALTYNLLGIYLNLTGNLDSSIVVLEKGLEINGDYAYRKPKFLANIGTAYRNNGDYNQSAAIFKELKKFYLDQNDSLGYANALGELAGVYNLTLQHEKAVKNLVKAINVFEENGGKKDRLGVMQQRLANSYMKQEKFDFALNMYEKALHKFKAADRMDNYYLTLINVADCYQYKKKYTIALDTINKSIEGLLPFNNSRLLAVAFGVKADVLKALKKYGEANNAYEEAIAHAYKISSNRTVQIAREFIELLTILENNTRIDRLIKESEPFYRDANIEYQYSYLEVVADAYSARSDYQKAFEISKKAHLLKDSSYQENKKQLVDDIQALYQVNEREKENEQLSETIVAKEKIISLLTLGLIVLFVMATFLIVIWLTRSNYQKRILSLEKERVDELDQKLKFEQENTRLKEQLIEKQKAELLGYSLEVANVNEKIDNLIKQAEKNGDNEQVGQQLKSMIKVNKSWDSFIERFKELDPEFIPNLSKAYPELTQKDLEFCSLVRINISYKDIANFLQISHDSVFKKRYRIAQKMNLEKGVEFQQFIIQF